MSPAIRYAITSRQIEQLGSTQKRQGYTVSVSLVSVASSRYDASVMSTWFPSTGTLKAGLPNGSFVSRTAMGASGTPRGPVAERVSFGQPLLSALGQASSILASRHGQALTQGLASKSGWSGE